jgi:hypothetical protein
VEKIAIDNDLVIKVILFRLGAELLVHCLDDDRRHEVGVLGTARWVCEARLQGSISAGQAPPEVIDDLYALLSSTQQLEPTRDELELAAHLEALAVEHRLPLDTGESQLAAIVASRGGLLATGDKRAIAALEHLSTHWPHEFDSLFGQVVCLEHAMLTLVLHLGVARVRNAVCQAPSADTAMRLAFSCSGGPPDAPPLGLLSYLNAVERTAPRLCTEAQSLCWESLATTA